MSKKLAFIDEYGTNELDTSKSDVASHFILTAVILNEPEYSNIKELIKPIQRNSFSCREIKSQAIGNKINRRIKILESLCKLNFNFFAFIVDKEKINSVGLSYKKTFYKYFHNLLESRLMKDYSNLDIIIDELGSEDFRKQMKVYLNRKTEQLNLFGTQSISFANSKDEVGIQIADFISGSLARYFDKNKKVEQADKIITILQPKVLELIQWPEKYSNYQSIDNTVNNESDSLIAEYCFNAAVNFANIHFDSLDESIQDQVYILHQLIFEFYLNSSNFICTDDLRERINSMRNNKYNSREIFRSNIIAKLRDKGVVIVSGTNGYKIPATKKEIIDYYHRYFDNISPMISQIELCNRSIKKATDNKVDVLEEPGLELFNKIVSAVFNPFEVKL